MSNQASATSTSKGENPRHKFNSFWKSSDKGFHLFPKLLHRSAIPTSSEAALPRPCEPKQCLIPSTSNNTLLGDETPPQRSFCSSLSFHFTSSATLRANTKSTASLSAELTPECDVFQSWNPLLDALNDPVSDIVPQVPVLIEPISYSNQEDYSNIRKLRRSKALMRSQRKRRQRKPKFALLEPICNFHEGLVPFAVQPDDANQKVRTRNVTEGKSATKPQKFFDRTQSAGIFRSFFTASFDDHLSCDSSDDKIREPVRQSLSHLTTSSGNKHASSSSLKIPSPLPFTSSGSFMERIQKEPKTQSMAPRLSSSLSSPRRLGSSFKSLLKASSTTDASSGGPAQVSARTTPVIETSLIYEKQQSYTQFNNVVQGKINQYLILREIGSGSYGRVNLCQNEFTDRYYACKIISKSKLQKKFRWTSRVGSIESRDPLSCIKKEIAILKKLSNHRNINSLVEVLDDENEECLYLIFELCEFGCVMNLELNQTVRPFSEELARYYFRQLFLGIEYLHKNRIIHQDIKPENLLLTADNTLQIADFGISRIFAENENQELNEIRTSPLFCPPEACQMELDTVSVINGPAFDVWSMGVTLFCFVHGHCPFEDDCIPDLYLKINKDEPQVSGALSVELKDLILQMMKKNPDQRISVTNIRSHEWVHNYGNEPLPSEQENSVIANVTDDEVSNAMRVSVFTRIRNLFKKSVSKVNIGSSL